MMLPTYLIYCTEHTLRAHNHTQYVRRVHTFYVDGPHIVLCVHIRSTADSSSSVSFFFSQGIKLIVAQQQHVHFVFCLWFVYFFCFSQWCWSCFDRGAVAALAAFLRLYIIFDSHISFNVLCLLSADWIMFISFHYIIVSALNLHWIGFRAANVHWQLHSPVDFQMKCIQLYSTKVLFCIGDELMLCELCY